VTPGLIHNNWSL